MKADLNIEKVIAIIREQDDKLNRLKAKILPMSGFEPIERYEMWRNETRRLIARYLKDEVGRFEKIERKQHSICPFPAGSGSFGKALDTNPQRLSAVVLWP
jgi:hypothetical protein